MRTYEGMFLLDSAQAVKDWEATVGVVTGILERYGAKMALNGKWDERKLAYPIKKKNFGVYHFWTFEVGGDVLEKLNFELRTSDVVLRSLTLNLDRELKRKRKLDKKRDERQAKKAAKKAAAAEAAAAADES